MISEVKISIDDKPLTEEEEDELEEKILDIFLMDCDSELKAESKSIKD